MTRHRPTTVPSRGRSRPIGKRTSRTPQDNVRVAACWVIERALATSAPVDTFLSGVLERFDERDRGLLQELVFGTLRWLRRIDDVLSRASHRPFEDIEPELRAPLRVAAYQLLFLDRVPAHAAVNEAVEEAGRLTHRGGASFTNAVLRRIARSSTLSEWPVREADPVRRAAIEMSAPDFLVRRWLAQFGEERTRQILAANNRPKPLHLLAFRDRGGRELLAERLIDQGFEVQPSLVSPVGLTVLSGNPLTSALYSSGEFYIQDEASQAAALVPPPRPGERVLDAAAAPGGKSFALLAAEPDVHLVLADASPSRLATLRQNLTRLKRTLPILAADAAAPPFADSARSFERVVIDLPCTGTGTLRKHPELKWRISEREIGRLSRQALRLLGGVAPLVASGGFLVAITCSLEREENEDVAKAFLLANPSFELADLEGKLPPEYCTGLEAKGRWRLFPEHEHDGFTVHAFVRR